MLAVLLIVSMALAAGWAGVRLWLDGRGHARALKAANAGLEARVAERTEALTRALSAAGEKTEALRQANDAKSEFLAGLSHELRTPLNAVLGFAELMRMNSEAEPLTRRQGQAVDQIHAAGRHLLTLVDEVLDLARIEAGRLSLSIERVDPQLVVRQVCDLVRPQAEAAGVTLSAPAPVAGLGVTADRTRLRQVLINLLTNAIKYNRRGGHVWVEMRQTPEGAAIVVRDSGIGLPAGRMAELFKPFSRLGREESGIEGTGVGLAVSRRLAEAMGGRIQAESVEGEGSTFTLHLPPAREPLPVVTASPLTDQALPEAVMLYVEDNPSNIALMRHVVAALGPIQLHVAETGHEGLALARDLRPDVIVLDINLPGLSGFELKARLDADPLTWGIPVLALSAGAMPADVRKGREAGFQDYLTKPLDIRAFAKALDRALSQPGDAERPRAA
jgi:signal transduction histidine kinase/CheY-like chemotaxis protein